MTKRASRRPQRRRSKPASSTSGAGTPGRPLSRMRTIGETADILNASSRTVRRHLDSGALPVHRIGRLVRIADADIALFLALHRDT
jgi:excisionase family DNA binding protein